ncbi:MAG: hybrid sensor histidine kinase/response regulator [Cyanobacteria bacterium P01_F01_bin.150]
MSRSEPFTPYATISPVSLRALQQTLQQATYFIRTQDPDTEVYIVQESSLGVEHQHHLSVEQFTLVISQCFSALLLVHERSEGGDDYPIELIFESEAIAHFLRQLMEIIPAENTLQTSLKQGLNLFQANHSISQSHFTLKLMNELAQLYAKAGSKKQSAQTRMEQRKHIVSKDTTSSSMANDSILNRSQQKQIHEPMDEQQQLLQQVVHQAQSADRVKSEFLAAMSHELRTPLTYILGMSATLLRWSGTGSNDTLPERQRHYLQNIHNQGEHLLELINDLLDLSQLESGHLGLELQEFSLTLLIQQSLNVYRKKSKQKGVILELDSHVTAASDRITADPHRLQQIVANLLSNAIKFTHELGKVTVRLSADKHFVEIQIHDTGIGIPDHHQALIFQKFKQLDSSYHRQYEGTGLGLALTKQLVDLHGGWIECDSTVGVGTVFTVKLPRHPFSKSSNVSFQAKRLPSSQSLGRIVLVDDNDESGHFVSDMLTSAGYQLVWILEGLTAISQLEMLQPTVVIINQHLVNNTAGSPNIIKVLRQNPMTKRIKILLLAHQSISTQISVESYTDADIVLSQPYSPEELLHKVGLLMAHISDEVSVQ